MTSQTSPTSQTARLLALFVHAQALSKVSIYLGYTAIAVFCVFGTLSSMAGFRQSLPIYVAFHYLPYVLVGISVPISLYQAFLLYRYRIVQPNILAIILLTGFVLPTAGVIFWLSGAVIGAFMAVFLAMIAWFAMPFLFKVNIARYINFLKEKDNDTQP